MIVHNCIQGTDEWKRLKVGVASASNVDKIITPKTMKLSSQADGYADLIAAERALKREVVKFKGNYNTERGKELEPDAVKFYEMTKNVECTHVGFITNDNGSFGCSPDALVSLEKGLELKCPDADTHVGYLYGGKLPDEYKCQVQSSLFVTGFKSWDFMSYFPELPEFVIPVLPDLEFHSNLEKALNEFEEMVQARMKKMGFS